MAFKVTLYQLEKRENSTKRPASNTTKKEMDCILRRGSSAIMPVLEFDFGPTSTGNPLKYNYAYISEFGRYYFIRDWSWIDGLWIAALECDVQAP